MDAVAEPRLDFSKQPDVNQLETRFDSEFGVLWGYMNPKPRPTFNSQLLTEASCSYVDEIADSREERSGESVPRAQNQLRRQSV